MRVIRLFVTICGSGIASTFWLLMVGRVVSGIGGAGIVPLTAIIITGRKICIIQGELSSNSQI